MELSLMVINLTFPILLDKEFLPNNSADIEAYEKVLKLAHDTGYKAVDLLGLDYQIFGVEKVKELLKKYEIECASIILFENYTCIDEREADRVRNYTNRLIDAAAIVKCPVMMLVALKPESGLTRSELQRGLVKNLAAAAEYAKNNEVTICIEDFPSLEIPMCSKKDIKYLLKHVKGIKLVYDSANMMVENETPQDYFENFKDVIGYYHMKDVRIADSTELFGDVMHDRKKMVATLHGKGIIDFKNMIKWIKGSGYKGYLSVEYAPDHSETFDVEKNLVEARELLENYILEA